MIARTSMLEAILDHAIGVDAAANSARVLIEHSRAAGTGLNLGAWVGDTVEREGGDPARRAVTPLPSVDGIGGSMAEDLQDLDVLSRVVLHQLDQESPQRRHARLLQLRGQQLEILGVGTFGP
jgi:hypothetical protein